MATGIVKFFNTTKGGSVSFEQPMAARTMFRSTPLPVVKAGLDALARRFKSSASTSWLSAARTLPPTWQVWR